MQPTSPMSTTRSAAWSRPSRTWASSMTRSSSISAATMARSAEGSPVGTPNEMTFFNGVEVPVADQMPFYDAWGSAETYPHYAVGWAWAMSTPYKWTKQVAGYLGGVRNGMVISWPAHIKDAGGIRNQFHHVIDIVPTILEATGIEAPDVVDGIDQAPIEGVSLAYTFDKANADAPSEHQTQYFEMFGERALYHDGWMASTRALPRAMERHRSRPQGRRQRRQVGALRPHQGLDAEQRRRRGQPDEAHGTPGHVLDRGGEVSGPAARRFRAHALHRASAEHRRRAATSSSTRTRSSARRSAPRRAFSTSRSRSAPRSRCPKCDRAARADNLPFALEASETFDIGSEALSPPASGRTRPRKTRAVNAMRRHLLVTRRSTSSRVRSSVVDRVAMTPMRLPMSDAWSAMPSSTRMSGTSVNGRAASTACPIADQTLRQAAFGGGRQPPLVDSVAEKALVDQVERCPARQITADQINILPSRP